MIAQSVRFVAVLMVVILLASCARLLMPSADRALGDLREGNYQLDPDHTTVLFKVDHLGISSFVGRFNRSQASLQFNPESPEKSRLDARVFMDSLDVNRPDFANTLMSCTWLCAEDFPAAEFVTTADATIEGSRLIFPGELSFRGQTHAQTMVVDFRGGADNMLTGRYTIGFDARLSFNRSDFAMDKYIPVVGDRVDIEVYAEFLREKD